MGWVKVLEDSGVVGDRYEKGSNKVKVKGGTFY